MGRHRIYDHAGHLAACELLFRDHSFGGQGDDERAVSHVIDTVLREFGPRNLTRGRPLFVNVTRPFLVGDLPMPCSPEGVVVEVSGDSGFDEALLDGVRRLREQGFAIAVTDFLGERHREALLPLADYVKIDAEAAGSVLPRLVALVRGHRPEARIVVANVPDEQAMHEYADLGCELFQGRLLRSPASLGVQSLSPSQVVCARLLLILGSGDPSAKDLEQVVSTDPSLTVRVLRAATSAATGVVTEVRSLRHALVLLGPKALSPWIMLTMLGGLSASQTDGLALVLARANTCAGLGRLHEPERVDVAYTVGLLSGLCDVLGADPAELAERTGVAEETRMALVENAGPCGALLSAVLAHEADWPDGVREAGLSVFEVSRTYLTALAEAMRTLDEVLG